jgi:hypothetical protein
MLSHDGDARRTTVVQLYLVFPKAAGEPPQLLRGFSKVSADAGGNVQAEFTLSARELSIWSSDAGAWKLVPGAFGVHLGFSSQAIVAQGTLHSAAVALKADDEVNRGNYTPIARVHEVAMALAPPTFSCPSGGYCSACRAGHANYDTIHLMLGSDSAGLTQFHASAREAIAMFQQYPGIHTDDAADAHTTVQYHPVLPQLDAAQDSAPHPGRPPLPEAWRALWPRHLPHRQLHRRGRQLHASEKNVKLAQKLGQLQPFLAVFPQECMGQLAYFGPT